jgi:hypothetical protein
LRFVGRADLITVEEGACSITDYKTGAQDQHHADQLRTYALLWRQDGERNPANIPVIHLILSYSTKDEYVAPPSETELNALARELDDRITRVETELQLRPPRARPALPMCQLCSVRHLCEPYWAGPALETLAAAPTDSINFPDCEATIISRNGPRSWMIQLHATEEPALLRTPTEDSGFGGGDRVRLLDVALATDDDTGRLTLTLTQTSEVYILRSESRDPSPRATAPGHRDARAE